MLQIFDADRQMHQKILPMLCYKFIERGGADALTAAAGEHPLADTAGLTYLDI